MRGQPGKHLRGVGDIPEGRAHLDPVLALGTTRGPREVLDPVDGHETAEPAECAPPHIQNRRHRSEALLESCTRTAPFLGDVDSRCSIVLLTDAKVIHTIEPVKTDALRAPASDEVPVRCGAQQPERRRRHLRDSARASGRVAEPHPAPALSRRQGFLQPGAALSAQPPVRINDNPGSEKRLLTTVGGTAHLSDRRAHQIPQAQRARRRQRGHRGQRPGLVPAQAENIRTIPINQGDPSAAPPGCVYRHAGRRQGFDVAQDRPGTDLQLGSELRRRNRNRAAAQNPGQSQQSISSHGAPLTYMSEDVIYDDESGGHLLEPPKGPP